MNQIIVIILAVLAGLLTGYAAGIGLFPLYNQPKNIKRQVTASLFAMAFLVLIILFIFL